MTKEVKEEIKEILEGLKIDFQLISNDSWIPEEDSFDASIEAIERLECLLK